MAGGLQAADGALAVGDATSNSEPTAAFLVRQGGLVRRVGPGSRVGSGPTSEPNDQTAPDRSLPELGTTCWHLPATMHRKSCTSFASEWLRGDSSQRAPTTCDLRDGKLPDHSRCLRPTGPKDAENTMSGIL